MKEVLCVFKEPTALLPVRVGEGKNPDLIYATNKNHSRISVTIPVVTVEVMI